MSVKVQAEFGSVDLAERAARVISEKVPDIDRIFIKTNRNYHPELTAFRQRGSTGYYDEDRSFGTIYDPGSGVYGHNDVTEPELRQNAYLSCITDDDGAKHASSVLRNLGGLDVHIVH